MGYGKKA